MTSRRSLLLGGALLAVSVPGIGLTQEVQVPAEVHAPAPPPADVQVPVPAPAEVPAKKPVLIVVQSSKAVTFDGSRLTLKGVSPTTIYFADRPERVTGHMTNRAFVAFWKDGRDTFLVDAPHATLSMLGQGIESDVVLELRDPVLKGDDLTYSATVLQGEASIRGGPASLFIDLANVPGAALASGMERRTWNRRGSY